ncbi:MAG: hypothetical protein IMZ47_05745 [Firmicutes bacterium]|nr:hypothetical protein [Bacillota bacterium]
MGQNQSESKGQVHFIVATDLLPYPVVLMAYLPDLMCLTRATNNIGLILLNSKA